MQRTLVRLIAIGSLAAALSACGAFIGSFLPDLERDNTFGLDGAEVAFAPAEATVSTASAGGGRLIAGFEVTLTVEDGVDVPDWIAPKRVTGGIGMEASVRVTRASGSEAPASFAIVGAGVQIEVFDGATRLIAAGKDNDDLQLTFELDGCDEPVLDREVCDYTLSTTNAPLLTVELTGAQARAYGELLRTPKAYRVAAQMHLDVEPLDAALVVLDATLQAIQGVIEF